MVRMLLDLDMTQCPGVVDHILVLERQNGTRTTGLVYRMFPKALGNQEIFYIILDIVGMRMIFKADLGLGLGRIKRKESSGCEENQWKKTN